MGTFDVLKIFIAPLLTFCISIASIIANSTDRKKGQVFWLTVFLLAAVASVTAFINYGDFSAARARERELKSANDELKSRVGDNVKQSASILERMIRQGLPRPGVEGNQERIINMYRANKAWQELAVKREKEVEAQGANSDRNLEIEYFVKDVDRPAFLNALLEAGLDGFNVKFVKSTRPYTISNSLWATDSVPVEDVKIVALTLMKEGIDLKFVGRFCDSFSKKNETLIQIGSETAFPKKNDPLTPEYVLSLTALPPNYDPTHKCG
jgi:hypothetical protein